MRTLKLKKCNRIHGIHFMPNGQLLVVGGYEAQGINDIAWFDLATGKVVRRLAYIAGSYAVSADFRRFVMTETFNPNDEGELIQFCDPLADPIEWQTLPTSTLRERGSDSMKVMGLAITPKGDRLYAGVGSQSWRPEEGPVWNHRAVVWSFDPPKLIDSKKIAHPFGIHAISPDGKRLATTGGSRGEATVVLYTRPDKPPVATFDPPQTRTRSLAYSPDGTRIAIANGQLAFLLTADNLTSVAELAGHAKQVNDLAFTPDGKRLMTVGHDGAIRMWFVSDGRPLNAYDWKIGPVTAVAVAPDGLTAAVAGKSGLIVVWDIDD